MFFMGVVNAFFVALSVPLSMFVAFVSLPGADVIVGSHVTLNFIVLFALLFGLGIIVDDAIVVIENTHRIFTLGKGKTQFHNICNDGSRRSVYPGACEVH
jgi:multidrug efflux pump subunit AcrB